MTTYEAAITALDVLPCACGHRYGQHDPEDARCDAPGPAPMWGQCPCKCFRSPDPSMTTNEYRLAALTEPRSVPCPTCRGTGCGEPTEWADLPNGTRPTAWLHCPDCKNGTVPAPSLLWGLLVERGDVEQVGRMGWSDHGFGSASLVLVSNAHPLLLCDALPVFRYKGERTEDPA